MKKETALKILGITITLALAVVLFFVFFGNKEEQTGEPIVLPPQPESNTFPITENNEGEFNNNEDNKTNSTSTVKISKLRQISENPISGFTIFDKTSTTTEEEIEEAETFYRFASRSNGNILETSSKTTNLKRLTNVTVPKLQKATFNKEGDGIIFSYLDDENNITSYFSNLTKKEVEVSSTTEDVNDDFMEIKSVRLPINIENISISPENLVLYTLKSNNLLNGFLFDVDSPDVIKKTLETKITQFAINWLNKDVLLLGTKPSSLNEGYLFTYNLNTKKLDKVIDGGIGFNFINNPNYDRVLYSNQSSQSMSSYVYDFSEKESKPLDLDTIVSDKCVWSNVDENIIYCAIPNSGVSYGYLTFWYQGQISFEDSLFRININNNKKEELEGLEGSFDISEIKISDNDEYLVFKNKKDLTLWSLDIKED